MNEITHGNSINPSIISETYGPTYFGCNGLYFDMFTLRYRMFGAVWKLIDGKRYILGYWFSDKESDINFAVEKAGWKNLIKADNEVKEIYQSIRTEQEKDNWTKKTKLPYFSMIKKPWKDWKTGWYILKSSVSFPCILTCIHKKRFSIWIEHVQVCETANDIKKFLNLIKSEHKIHLESGEIQEKGITNGIRKKTN